ncbi:MAG: B12-binding domain-containing radical SAM protein [Phycisphaeraceae bacterium]|nr:B12-binding domain-containing radical SAM protein [Phycisphaeraceae bacterium]
MNILLVYPAFPDTFWSFRHALKFVHKRAAFPPLGLLTIAAMLPEHWDKRLIDVNIEKLTERDLAWADAVMISGMTVQRDSARQIVDRCKAAGKCVIAGGPLFTSEFEDFTSVDHFLLGEAEGLLPRLIADLENHCAERFYESDHHPDIHDSPTPLWTLAKLKRYASMSVQFSRGCPFDCDFCNITALFGRKPRVKSAARVVREFDSLYAAGWRGPIFVVDDNLIGNKKLLKTELLPALIEWRKGKRALPLQTQVSINLVNDEPMMQQMVEAGFDTVFIGIETPDELGLAACDKRQNLHRDLVADVKTIQHHGLQVQAGFIVGFDTDTPSIFQRQIDFIQNSGIVTAMVGLLQAPIGTRLYERMRVEGRLLGKFTGDNVDGTTNVRTKMDLEPLKAGYRQVMNHLYSPEQYYQRIKTFLREYRPAQKTDRVRWPQLLAFGHSIVRLGVLSRGRLHYWKLLLWTLFTRRRQLPLAVTLWIYGHHFRKVCRLHLA